jgi:oligoribonuclease
VLEVALVVTDKDLNLVEEGPVLVVHQTDAVLDGMDSWNKGTHGKSGLIDKVKASTLSEADVEQQMIDFMARHVGKRVSPMCGNSICQDRRFLARHMPKLEDYFHYRNLDVSTLKELAARWRPELKDGFKKANAHTALADIMESIEELKYYREHFIRMP